MGCSVGWGRQMAEEEPRRSVPLLQDNGLCSRKEVWCDPTTWGSIPAPSFRSWVALGNILSHSVPPSPLSSSADNKLLRGLHNSAQLTVTITSGLPRTVLWQGQATRKGKKVAGRG